MQTIFSALWVDLCAAALFGAIGGFGLGLLQEKGLELPRLIKESGRTFVDLGFIGDILVGMMAAILMYALNPPDDLLGLLASAIPAGVGGSAVLKGYISNTKARIQANRAEMYRATAWDASRGMDVAVRLEELQATDAQTKQRWGAW